MRKVTDTTDTTTAVHEAGHALVGYALYGDNAIALIRLRGKNRLTDIPDDRRCVKRRLISGIAQEVSSPDSTDAIAVFGSVSFAGLAAEKILLAPPLDWSHGIKDGQSLVETITGNDLPYPTFDASNVKELRKHAKGEEPYVNWFKEAHRFLNINKSALSQFSDFLESFTEPRVPGEVANAEIKKALGW